ncbi:MAG: hypothetical protein R3E90_13890 [Marinicella sp.]
MKGWFKRLFQSNKKAAKPVYYFTHIPKTAGTSFIVLLDRFFDANTIYPYQLWREAKDIDVENNQRYDLFRGHFGGGGVTVLTDRNIEYLTILRTPASLALSTYEFVKRESNTKVHQLVKEKNMSFAQFMQHPMTAPLVKNRMIRNISFDFVEDPAAQEVFLSAETIEYLQSIIEKQRAPISDFERLRRAQKFIGLSCWFGLLERFDDSMQLLCYTMGWPPIGASQKLNTHDRKQKLSSQEQSVLEQANAEDLSLYQYASGLFEHKLDDMNQQLEALRTSPDQTVDDLLDIHYQQQQAVKENRISAPSTYDFSQKLLGQQWHRRELIQPENEYFRWTGPNNRASIDFWVEPKDYCIRIRIINATSPGLLDTLQITINGHPVTWNSTDQGVVRIITLDCPQRLIKANGLLRLGLRCQSMISHQQAFGSDDERLVGVAVHWIQFDDVEQA